MDLEANKAALKHLLIKYLKTCPEYKCKKKKFWDNVNIFNTKTLRCQDYGVSTMNSVLKDFKDDIEIVGKHVVLKKFVGKKEVVVSDSDDDDTDSNNSAQTQVSTHRGSASIRFKSKGNRPGPEMSARIPDESVRDKIISVLKAENGQCGLWKFLDCYRKKYGDLCDLEKQVQINSDILTIKKDVIYLLKDCKQSSSQQQGSLIFTSSKIKPPSWGSGLKKDSDEESDSDDTSINSQNSSTPQTSGFIPLSGKNEILLMVTRQNDK